MAKQYKDKQRAKYVEAHKAQKAQEKANRQNDRFAHYAAAQLGCTVRELASMGSPIARDALKRI